MLLLQCWPSVQSLGGHQALSPEGVPSVLLGQGLVNVTEEAEYFDE